jgi:hypothetical protein
MVQIVLVGIVAGLAAALLCVAPFGGTSLVLPLFALTGLPIAIAGLAWSLPAAIVASVVAGAALSVALSPLTGLIFLLVLGAPVTWVVRLAGLSRQVTAGQPDSPIEWYPLGRMLAHLSVAVALGIIVTGILVGFDVELLVKVVTDALLAFFSSSPDVGVPPSAEEIEPFVRLNVAAMPVTSAIFTMTILAFDLWLAARIARVSGRLARPPERMWSIELPRAAVYALGATILLAFLPRPLGAVAGVFAGALGTAAAITGLAVMHAVTAGNGARAIILTIAYASLLLLGFPILLFAALGAADSFLHFRARRFGATPPNR